MNTCVFAQINFTINWENNYGGSDDDYLRNACKSHGNGYILCGASYSSNIDLTGNNGQSDGWLVKTSETGAIEWQKNYGGTSEDYCSHIQATSDGGYIFVGLASSNDGDITGYHGGYGDVWVVKIDSDGNIEWQKCYGGTGYDYGARIFETSTGNFIVGASAGSDDGDISTPTEINDFWVFMINNTGNIIWEKTFGSTEFDFLLDMKLTNDGGCVVSGFIGGNGGNVTNYYGYNDAWVAKLNSTGNLEWEKTFGGTEDDMGNAIAVLPTGDYILAFSSESSDGTMSSNNGDGDMWIAKLSSTTLTLDWEQSFGGSLPEESETILIQADGILVGGTTNSFDGNISSNNGQQDAWVIKVDNSGALVWEKNFGGSYQDNVTSVIGLTDNNLVIAGFTNSNDYDIGSNNGMYDFWLANVDITTSINDKILHEKKISLFPNPARDKINVQGKNILTVELYNYSGSCIHSTSCNNQNNITINIPVLPDGFYFIKIETKDNTYFEKIELIK